MKTHTHILHSAKVKNNCPLCYSTEGLEFTFIQEEVENKFYSKAQKEVHDKLYCHNCEQQVHPVEWTEDVDRVHEYHKKLATPKGSGIQLKPISYLIILSDALLIGWLIYYFS